MSISYNTSNQNYKVIIPASQAEILEMNQELVPNLYNSYAPIRNHHNFSVLPHDLVHDFYFSPNYDYDRDSIIEYQQVIIDDGEEGGGSCDCSLYWEDMSGEDGQDIKKDKFSIFTVNEPAKILTINYSTNISDIEDDLFSLFTIQDKDLNIEYNN